MKYNSILTFFQCHPGEKDFFDLLGYHLHGEQFDPENSIAPLEEISSSYKSLAEDLQTASSFAYLGTGLARKEDRLREAAKIHLKTGNIHQYCEIMVQLGNWERALAFAPAHCPDYWQELTDRYAEHLQRAQNEETGTFLISGKKINDAIQFFLKRGEGEDALVLSSVKSAGLFPENQPGKPAEINKSTVTEGEMATLKQIVNKYSMPKFNS